MLREKLIKDLKLATGKMHYLLFKLTRVHPKYQLERIIK